MNKSGIIEQAAKDKRLEQAAKNITKGADLWADLLQETLLALFEKPEEVLQALHSDKKLQFYAVRIMLNLYNSRTSPFYRKYRHNDSVSELPESMQDAEDEEYIRETDEEHIARLKQELSNLPDYEALLYTHYNLQGRKTSRLAKATDIPARSIRATVQRVEEKIRQNMTPIKILVIAPPLAKMGGVEYHRLFVPHDHLGATYRGQFEISMADVLYGQEEGTGQMRWAFPDSTLKDFQIVLFSRTIPHHETVVPHLRKLGCKVVLDIDDYWHLSADHALRQHYRKNRTTLSIIESMEAADYVTTTTPILAQRIRQHNENVIVLPNAINPDLPQFEQKRAFSARMGFGWMGGACHLEDVRLMQDSLHRLNTDKSLAGQYELRLAGWNAKDAVYKKYDSIFRSGLNAKLDAYARIKAAPVTEYAFGYNHFDVALAPLNRNAFNSCKSELKMIEAGFMEKAVIVSQVEPYTLLIRNKVNCLAVRHNQHKAGWYDAIRYLIQNPNCAIDIAAALHEDVSVKYHIITVNETRKDFYKSLIINSNA